MLRRVATILFASLLVVGCNEDANLGVEYSNDEEGVVNFGVTRAGDDELFSNSILKIYSVTMSDDIDGAGTAGLVESLVRRYSPMSDMPELISLVAGDYRVSVEVGDSTSASFDSDKLTYSGENEFEVVAQESQTVEVNCDMDNTVVRIEFDETIISNLKAGYTVTVMAADSFDETLIGAESTPQLVYETDCTGYFLLPSGVNNISWKFTGVKSVVTDDGDGVVEMTGVIESPQAREQTTVLFSFPKYLTFSESLSIYVDDSTEDHDDSFSFALQPQISGDALLETHEIIGDTTYSLSVSSILDIQSICLTVDESTKTEEEKIKIYPFANNAVVEIDEASFLFNEGSTTSGVLTLNRALFDLFEMGGEHSLKITVTDVTSVEGFATLSCKTSGVTSVTAFDLWENTCVLSAIDLEGSGDVSLEYRVAGTLTQDWIACDNVVSSDGVTYSAAINPVWVESTNDAGHTIHQMTSGITSGATYECRLVSAKREYAMNFTSTTGGNQLANYDMEDSGNLAYTESSSSSSSWTSGNNSYAEDDLCSEATINSATSLSGTTKCAKLTSTTAGTFGIYKFAAGNMMYGQFDMGFSSGTVSFGQPFTWTARPQKFRVKYAATLGALTHTDTSVYTGSMDRGLIYFAIVDWSGRHDVTSGTSSTSGAWTPFDDIEVDKGDIIGYAYTYIDESTATTTELYDLEMDVVYYDKVTNPTDSDISIVVSCASSAYGDYFVGSTSSRMWVDDFEIVY